MILLNVRAWSRSNIWGTLRAAKRLIIQQLEWIYKIFAWLLRLFFSDIPENNSRWMRKLWNSAHLLRFLSVAASFTANSDIKLQRAVDDVMHGKLRNFCSPASLFLLSCFVHYSVANPFLRAIATWNYNAQFMTWWSWVSVCWRILFWEGICFSNVFFARFFWSSGLCMLQAFLMKMLSNMHWKNTQTL